MEGSSKNRDEYCPHLIDLIHNDREWIVRENEGNLRRLAEEKKLELKLGPPGEEAWFINETNKNNSTAKAESHPLSFGCFSSMVSKTHNSKNQNQKISSMETQQVGNIFSSSWCPGSSPSSSPSTFHIKTQHQFQPSYLQFQSVPQNLPAVAKESLQMCSTKVVVELQKNHTEKKACFPTSASVTTANTAACNSSQKRTAPAPVVGWPPIRSFRKNLSNINSSKPTSDESEKRDLTKEPSSKMPEKSMKGLWVKINMDGVPIGRKVDIRAYDSYDKLSSAVDELFRSLLAAQRDSLTAEIHNKIVEVEAITGLLDRTGEYTLVYEDNEGDRMLVGDVPWHMFASTVKRLRVLKSSELSTLHLGCSKQEKRTLDSAVKM